MAVNESDVSGPDRHDGNGDQARDRPLLKALRTLIERRGLLLRAVFIDLRSQYAGTALGLVWVVLGPLLLLSLYTVIYVLIYKLRVSSLTRAEYVLHVFAGLVPFLAFAQSLSASATSIGKERKLLYSTFPYEFVPMKAVISAHLILVPATAMIFLGDLIFSKATWTLLLVPVVALAQLMFTIGLGFFLAAAALVLRDINFLIQYIVIALLVTTPIGYTPDMVPAAMKPLLYANPLFYFVTANQYLILMNKLPPMDIVVIGLSLAVVTFIAGFWFFHRVRSTLVDLL